jgi:hypothetical protein
MPRHTFRFDPEVQEAVKDHVRRGVEGTNPEKYLREPQYTAALARSLEGVAYDGPLGRVEFSSTVVDSNVPNSAEKWSGADLAITAEISKDRQRVRKAILVQAKMGPLEQLAPNEVSRLLGQVRDMQELTASPKIMDIQRRHGGGDPGIYSGNIFGAGGRPQRLTLADYFVRRVLTTLDGDTRPTFVDGVQESKLTKLRVVAYTRYSQ